MRRKHIYVCAILASLTILISCKPSATSNHNSHEGHNHGKESTECNDSHESEKSEEIIFEPQKAKQFDVQTTVIKVAPFEETFKVAGSIIPSKNGESLVVAPSSGIVTLSNNITEGASIHRGSAIATISAKNLSGGDQNEAARITYLSAKRELERVKPLYDEKIITERDYNAIKTNFEKAKIAYLGGSKNGTTASSPISGVISSLTIKSGEYVEIGMPIAYISNNNKLMLKADVPEKYFDQIKNISSANIKTSYNNEVIRLKDLNAKKISNIPSNANSGYIPIYFEFDSNGGLVSGTYVEVYLIGSIKEKSIFIPIESITEEQGEFFVYVKIDEEGYNKRLVKLGNSNGKFVEIISGVHEGDEVVTKNATMIKLAANSGAIPEGHNHNH